MAVRKVDGAGSISGHARGNIDLVALGYAASVTHTYCRKPIETELCFQIQALPFVEFLGVAEFE